MSAFCRDCLSDLLPEASRCTSCGGRRILAHQELGRLAIAHVDCDAFYAAIEKRDNSVLRDRPLIVGGSVRRGVVLTACYIARQYGVRSAMPMFQALKKCPEATVVGPNFLKYSEASRKVRAAMRGLTPLVEPLSLDEAYLDLSGTERLHGCSPAKSIAKMALDVEKDVGITVSIGLSHNKFLAKMASDLNKPRGFAVIGVREAKNFVRQKPIALLRGAGDALQARLAKDGITMIAQLQDADPRELSKRYGSTGIWLRRMSLGEDTRKVDPGGELKSVSCETTFDVDYSDFLYLEKILWRQSERVSARAKKAERGGWIVTLKLKAKSFRTRTRSQSLDVPTQLADRIFRTARELLRKECDGTAYRLLGVGLSHLVCPDECDPTDFVDQLAFKRAKVEGAVDKLRERFGGSAVGRGVGLERYPTTR